MAIETYIFKADSPERLDIFLARVLPKFSRSLLQRLCHEGSVVVAGKVQTKPSYQLKGKEEIAIAIPKIEAPHGELPILYEDSDVMVINKPAGILTHTKGTLSEEFSVAEFIRAHISDEAEGNRPGIVHRLDRGTSGVIITAKNPNAKRWLQKQFSSRKVKKTYIALVEGRPKLASAHITLPIERNPKQPQTFRVGANGKPAETVYETLQTYKSHTLLKLHPLTGRTHQLRVHLRHLQCPIAGDPIYGHAAKDLGRMFLHASELEITLPKGERKAFSAPLPPELENYLHSLQ